jgi:molybdenum cofactor cytidylyltransferase
VITAGAVLAAGAGRRFGDVKQLAAVEGQPLVRIACTTALAAGLAPVIVVVGAHRDQVAAVVTDLPVVVTVNEQWARGLGSSLAHGVRLAAADPDVAAVAVLLADQPRVTVEHVRGLCADRERTAAEVAVSRYDDLEGVPAVFARSQFAALIALDGDVGARSVIAAAASKVWRRHDPARFDIDTPDDLVALRRRSEP